MLFIFNPEDTMQGQARGNILSSDVKRYFVEKCNIPDRLIIINVEITDKTNMEFSVINEKKGTY